MSQPLISIDVVPIRFNQDTRKVEVILGRRVFEPALGALALPGVLLDGAERLQDAVSRALSTKVGLELDQWAGSGEVGVFDNPDRDPRGPTLSITRFVIVGRFVQLSELATAVPMDAARGLPFDHDAIIRRAAQAVSEKLWSDDLVTRALIGAQFSTLDVADIQDSLVDSAQLPAGRTDRNNLARFLTKSPLVRQSDATPTAEPRAGRKAKVWEFV